MEKSLLRMSEGRIVERIGTVYYSHISRDVLACLRHPRWSWHTVNWLPSHSGRSKLLMR